MSIDLSDPQRRALLKAASTGVAIATLAALDGARAAKPDGNAPPPEDLPPRLARRAVVPRGRPGEFDFLTGDWRIHHRKPKADGRWDSFEGEATCHGILGGIASIEELRIPARDFSGMGIRLLDVEKQEWSDFWVNAKSGVLATPGTAGGFVDGVGVFESVDGEGDAAVIYRGVWDRITGHSHRWYAEISKDGGKTWQVDWLMDWTRKG
jgi:hypothetical protein